MIYIQHRVNTIEQLRAITDLQLGCEIDIRSDVGANGRLHISHDPGARGEDLNKWLEIFKNKNLQGPLILNTKEDGLEEILLKHMNTYKIENFFFLDTTLPTLVKWTHKGVKKFAVRYSNQEPIELASQFRGLADWVWVDCFDGRFPPLVDLKEFKTCLVSPELQGQSLVFSSELKAWAKQADAACTKKPLEWANSLG